MTRLDKPYYFAIDGLRGLAVLAVILFHLEFEFFSGGYIGVDIFFVISGYLITSNIIRDYDAGNFSFWYFYKSRIWRLVPAMLATVFFTLLFGVLLLSPDALIRLSSSAIASVVSLANIRFWLVSDYFDVDASLKPLLHFWSLSVEEQFYVFWPCVLVVLLKFTRNRHWVLICVFALAFLSFVGSQFVLINKPASAFYLVQFRAYEFILGGMLVLFERGRFKIQTQLPNTNNISTIIGLILIGYASFLFTKETVFPGYSSLIPCAGALLIIYSRDSNISEIFLTNKLIVSIGKVSYSLYLVHWPIWVYASYWSYTDFNILGKLALFLLMLLCGYILYQTVENKYRYVFKGQVSSYAKKRQYLLLVFTATILLSLSFIIRHQSGLPSRISHHYPRLVASEVSCVKSGSLQECTFGDSNEVETNVLLIGDSHSMNLRHGLDKFGRNNNIAFDSVSAAGCAPIFDTELHYNKFSGADKNCLHFNQLVLTTLSEKVFETVILSARWMWLYEHEPYGGRKDYQKGYLLDQSSRALTSESSRLVWKSNLTKTVQTILSRTKKVVVISQYPLLKKGIGECDKLPSYLVSRQNNETRCHMGIAYDEVLSRLGYTNDIIDGLAGENVMVIKPSDHLCDSSLKNCDVLTEQGLLYADDNHLSSLGSEYLIDSVTSQLITFIAK